MKLYIGAIAASVLLSGCGTNELACDDKAVPSIIIDILKENKPFISISEDHRSMYDISHYFIPFLQDKHKDKEFSDKWKAIEDDYKLLLTSAKIKTSQIRMVSRDSNTKAVTCVAKLDISHPIKEIGGPSTSITYKLERTTDNDIYMSILE